MLRSWIRRFFVAPPARRRRRAAGPLLGQFAAPIAGHRHLEIQALEERRLLAVTAVGAEFLVPTSTAFSQGSRNFSNGGGTPRGVAMNSSGAFVAAWIESISGIAARRFDSNGVAQGSQFFVSTVSIPGQGLPTVGIDDAGGFVVVWQTDDSSGTAIHGKRYNSSGVLQGGQFEISTLSSVGDTHPSVAMNGSGAFVVTWERLGADGVNREIFAQRYDASGVRQGSEFQVNTYTTDDQSYPQIAIDASGDFVAVWMSNLQDGQGTGIYGQRYAASGALQGSEFRVNAATDLVQRFPVVAMDPQGDFVVTFEGQAANESGYGIYARRFDANGNAQGGDFRANTYTTGDQQYPSVAMDQAGNFVVTWGGTEVDGQFGGVRAQYFDLAGVAQGSEFQVNTFTTSSQQLPAVAMDANGNFVIIWESDFQDGSGPGLYGQRHTVNPVPTPTLSINDVTVTETDSGSVNAVFTVSISPAINLPVAVNFTTGNGTATQPSDYAAKSGSVTFAPGVRQRAITVSVATDNVAEADENFTVTLSNPSGALLADSSGAGTILDDDRPPPTISIQDVQIVEGNSGTTNAVVTVALSATHTAAINVNYATVNGTAVSPSDYTATSGTLTFAAGTTTQTITLTIIGDTAIEGDEDFQISLTNAVNATIADNLGVVTITGDDLPSISIDDVTISEGNVGFTNFVFLVSLSSSTAQTVRVNFTTQDDVAAAPGDYLATSGTLTFNPGVTARAITISVVGDLTVEFDDTFVINLSNPVNATISDTQGVGTITNDDLPGISIGDVSLQEGNSGTTTAVFTVSLSTIFTGSVNVAYATANGTATSPGDYTAKSGTLTFASGVTSQTVTVVVNGDTQIEPDETFTVNLSNPVNGTILDNQAVGTILNDDLPSLTVADISLSEGNAGGTNAVFTVSLSAPAVQTTTVEFTTVNGSATSIDDYIATSGTITFAAGVSSRTITVTVLGDTQVESDETFGISLTNAASATIGDGVGLTTITNDDLPPPTISISDASVTEGNSGTASAVFTVSLSAAASQTVTVSYTTVDAGAVAPGDYTAKSGTLTFAVGTTSQTITVSVVGETLVETDETFNINLSNPTNATIGDGQGVGTILTDDAAPPPSMTIGDVTVNEGNSGTTSAVFTVTLSAASLQTITVAFSTNNVTASSFSDYNTTSGTLTFAVGVTTRTITVAVLGDTLNEPDETFAVGLSSPTNATIADNLAVGKIANDDLQWHNANLPPDIDVSGAVSGIDLIYVVEALNTYGAGLITNFTPPPTKKIDVNGDNNLSAIDLVLVVDALNTANQFRALSARASAPAPAAPQFASSIALAVALSSAGGSTADARAFNSASPAAPNSVVAAEPVNPSASDTASEAPASLAPVTSSGRGASSARALEVTLDDAGQ